MNNICNFNEVDRLVQPVFTPSDLTFFVDLIYFDGPLLSLFNDKEGHGYIYYWCDIDENYNRRIIFRIDKTKLKSFILMENTLKDLVLNPSGGILYVVDIDDKLEYQNIQVVRPDELPESYVPENDSYYDLEAELDEESKIKIFKFLDISYNPPQYQVKAYLKQNFDAKVKLNLDFKNFTEIGKHENRSTEIDSYKYQTAA